MDFRRSTTQGAHCHADIIYLSPQLMEAYGTSNAGRRHIFAFHQVCFFPWEESFGVPRRGTAIPIHYQLWY